MPYLTDQRVRIWSVESSFNKGPVPIFLMSAVLDVSWEIVECVCQAVSSFQFSMIALIGSHRGSFNPPHFQTSQHNSVKHQFFFTSFTSDQFQTRPVRHKNCSLQSYMIFCTRIFIFLVNLLSSSWSLQSVAILSTFLPCCLRAPISYPM